MADRKAEGCVLTDRKTDKPAGQVQEFWQRGELDVTGRITPAGTDDDFSAARDDAIRRAKLVCAEKYTCTGKCGDKDRFCVVDVEVKKDKSGKMETREVDVPESPFGGPAHKETRRYITYEVKVVCKCSCAKRPQFIVPGTGESQQSSFNYKETFSLRYVPTISLTPLGYGSDVTPAAPRSDGEEDQR